MRFMLVYLRSTVVDERTGRPFRWHHRMTEDRARAYAAEVNRLRATQGVVAWLEGEPEPPETRRKPKRMR